jgi:hypothetical protein
MKRFLIGCLLFVVGLSANAQNVYQNGSSQPAFDQNGNYTGVLTPTHNQAGFYGFVPPTQNYAGIMAALHAAIASPIAKNVLFESATYNLGANYVPLVSGIGYIGSPPELNYTAGHDSQANSVVAGTIFTGSGSVMMWDGAADLSAITTTLATQTSTTTSGSTNIAVPNSSLFTVGQRVYLTTYGGGFYSGISYYVLSAAANKITLGLPDMVAINATSSATISIAASFPNDSTSGILIKDLACNSCNTFIKTGAKNTGGLQFSKIENIQVHGTAGYRAMDNSNFNALVVTRIYTNDCDGQYWGSNSPGDGFQWGNSFFSGLLNSNNGGSSTPLAQHGIIFQAENASNLNELHIASVQNNNAYISTQVVTTSALTNTSPNIPVANSALFPVGLPVWISTTSNPNGFTTSLIYWVVSSSANVIQLATTKGGTAVNSTGTLTMNISSQGFSGLEIVGIGSGVIGNSDASGLDIEGQSSALITLQHANVTIPEIGQANTPDGHVVAVWRAYSGMFGAWNNAASIDADSVSSPHFFGQKASGYGNLYSSGMWYDSGQGVWTMNLYPGNNQATPTMQSIITTASGEIVKFNSPAVSPNFTQDTSKTYGFPKGTTVFSGATGQTMTLPTITNASAATSMLGIPFPFFNASTNNLTIATNGTQTLGNKAGVTSMTLTPQQWGTYFACINAAATLFWCVQTNGTF